MSEAVPLAATLSIELDSIVVHRSRGFIYDPVAEVLTAVPGHLRPVEVPVKGDAGADLDFACGGLDDFRGEEVEAPQLVVVPEQTPGVPGRPVFTEGKRFERWLLHVQIRAVLIKSRCIHKLQVVFLLQASSLEINLLCYDYLY